MALSLVSYDDSEESDNENDEPLNEDARQRANPVLLQKKVDNESKKDTVKTINPTSSLTLNDSDDEFDAPDLETDSRKRTNFHLPESKTALLNTDIDIKCLTSKRNGPVKITIPSLNKEDEETDQPLKKKLKPSQKGSGLFALLPSPKSSLVPQSVVNRNRIIPPKSSNTVTTKKIKPAPTISEPKKIQVNKSALISYDDSGDEDEPVGTVDFFSLDRKDEELPVPTSDIVDISEVNQPAVQNVPVKDTTQYRAASSASHPSSSGYHQPAADVYHTSDFVSTSTDNLQLDDEAMQQLCGRRDRMKRQELNIIDVSGDAIMPDSREWLTKQLSEEQAHRPSHKKKDGPTSQQKRKHQITYLAFQAKENELELKNQWANNRMTRKQTQSKYGF